MVGISHVALHQLAFGDIMLPVSVEQEANGQVTAEFRIEEIPDFGLRNEYGYLYYDSVSCYNERGLFTKMFASKYPTGLMVGDVVTVTAHDDDWRKPSFAEDLDDGYTDEFS